MIYFYQYNLIEFLYQVISTGGLRTLSITRDIFFISACYSFEPTGYKLIGSTILYGFKLNQIIKRQLFKLPILQRLKELRSSDIEKRDSFNFTTFIFGVVLILLTSIITLGLGINYMSLKTLEYETLYFYVSMINLASSYNYVGYILIKILSEDCNNYFIETISNMDPVLYIFIALIYYPGNPFTNITPISGKSFAPNIYHILIPVASVVLMSLRASYMCGYIFYLTPKMIYSKVAPIYTIKEIFSLSFQSGGKSLSNILNQTTLLSLARHAGFIREISLIEAARAFGNTLVNCIKKWCTMTVIHSSIISKKTEDDTSAIQGFKNVIDTIPTTIMLMCTSFLSAWISGYYFDIKLGIELPIKVTTICFILEHLWLFPNTYCDILTAGLKYWNTSRKLTEDSNNFVTKIKSYLPSMFSRSNMPFIQTIVLSTLLTNIGYSFNSGFGIVYYYFFIKTLIYSLEMITISYILYEGLLYKIDFNEYSDIFKKQFYKTIYMSYEFITFNFINLSRVCSYINFFAYVTLFLSKFFPVFRNAFSVNFLKPIDSFTFLPGYRNLGIVGLPGDLIGTFLFFSNINQSFTGVSQIYYRMGFKTMSISQFSQSNSIGSLYGMIKYDPVWLTIDFSNLVTTNKISLLSWFHNLMACLILCMFSVTYAFYLFNKTIELKMIDYPFTNNVYKINKQIGLISSPEYTDTPMFFLESSNYTNKEYERFISENGVKNLEKENSSFNQIENKEVQNNG